jgi:hypothetical protein
MFVQPFRSYFSEEIFLWSLSEWLSAQACIRFKKHTKLIIQIKIKKKTENKGKNKGKREYLHNIQG